MNLDNNQKEEFIKFVMVDLSEKYNIKINVDEDYVIRGIAPNEEIKEALKIRFLIDDAQEYWIEDRIATDVHKYCFLNKLYLIRSPVFEKDVWNGKIRYSIILLDE